MTTFLVKRAEQYVLYKHGVKKYAAQGKCLYMCAYLVLIFFCVIHNVDMYPKYPSENTIDMQAYIYFFQEKMIFILLPGYNLGMICCKKNISLILLKWYDII